MWWNGLFGKILLRKYIFFEENPTKQNPKIYGIDLKILGQPQNLLNFPSTLTKSLFGSKSLLLPSYLYNASWEKSF